MLGLIPFGIGWCSSSLCHVSLFPYIICKQTKALDWAWCGNWVLVVVPNTPPWKGSRITRRFKDWWPEFRKQRWLSILLKLSARVARLGQDSGKGPEKARYVIPWIPRVLVNDCNIPPKEWYIDYVSPDRSPFSWFPHQYRPLKLRCVTAGGFPQPRASKIPRWLHLILKVATCRVRSGRVHTVWSV